MKQIEAAGEKVVNLKYLRIILQQKDLPAEYQYHLFESVLHFFDGIRSERAGHIVYIAYDEADVVAARVVSQLDRYFAPGFVTESCPYHCFEDCKKEILHPIHEEIDITVFPYITMFLPVIIGHKKYESWYYCNFLNIMCVNEKGFYNYTDDRSFFRRILSENSFQYIKSFRFDKKTFIDSLFANYYIYVWIDSCFTGDWSGRKDTHEAHPVLIYGVDTDKNIYYCYRFSPKKGVFKCEYEIDMFHDSMQSARCEISHHVDDFHVCIFQLKDIAENNLFDKERFTREFGNYIFSAGDRTKEYCRAEINILEHTDICFGIGVTENVILLLEGAARNMNFDYRLIHLITEQKQLLYKRIRYAIRLFSIRDPDLTEKTAAYHRLVARYDLLRSKYKKQSILESRGAGFFRPPESENTVIKLTEEYKNAAAEEQSLLEFIYDKLSYYLKVLDIARPGTNYFLFAQKDVKEDAAGFYQFLSWEEPIETQKIIIKNTRSSDPRYCRGLLLAYDGVQTSSYECRTDETGTTGVTFDEIKTVEWIKFYPQKYLLNERKELNLSFHIFENNLLLKAKRIVPSSVYIVAGLDCSAENMVRDDLQFWCPAIEDRVRAVVFEFDRPIAFNCCVIAQDFNALRIATYKIEYFAAEWRTAFFSEKAVGMDTVAESFERVPYAEKVRLSITSTVPSRNGYDVPNINKFALYDQKDYFDLKAR